MRKIYVAFQAGTAPANTNKFWNAFSASVESAPLADGTEQDTDVTLTIAGTPTTAPEGAAPGTGAAAWVDETIIAAEAWSTGAGSGDLSMPWALDGFASNEPVRIKIFSYRGTLARDTGHAVAGEAEQVVTANDLSEIADFDVLADSGGGVSGYFIERNSNNFGYINAMEIEFGGAAPTTRKGSTFDVETTLSGTVTTATLNGVDVSDHITGQVGTTISFDGGLTAEITTSGEYDLVLTDDSADPDETITVQVNVVGLPSNTARKDGALLASLTDLTLDAVNSSGTLVKQLTGITTDASGVISPVDLSDLSEAVGDTLKISLHSAASDVGVTFEQALELI